MRGIGVGEATALLGPSIEGVLYGEVEAPTVHLAHPGILMGGNSKGRRPSWLERHTKEHIPALRAALGKLGRATDSADR